MGKAGTCGALRLTSPFSKIPGHGLWAMRIQPVWRLGRPSPAPTVGTPGLPRAGNAVSAKIHQESGSPGLVLVTTTQDTPGISCKLQTAREETSPWLQHSAICSDGAFLEESHLRTLPPHSEEFGLDTVSRAPGRPVSKRTASSAKAPLPPTHARKAGATPSGCNVSGRWSDLSLRNQGRAEKLGAARP